MGLTPAARRNDTGQASGSMTRALPSSFLSHGAPDLLRRSAAHEFLAGFGGAIAATRGHPKAILVASAHFETAIPMLTADEFAETVYDFGGFDPRLYIMRYPTPGSPSLAGAAVGLLQAAGLKAAAQRGRGYDRGTWVPMMLLFPQADIPVVQISVQPLAGAAHHLAVAALAPLREAGVLIIGSGLATHNLQAFFRGGYREDSPPPDWVVAFSERVHRKVEAGACEEIADYRRWAPFAVLNRPSEEHFLPLPVAMGAAGPHAKGELLHSSHEYGVLLMDVFQFQ
jgi:4,5-DOPA dioxygenase extradiol